MVILVVAVGLVALFGLVNSSTLTGMASAQKHIFFSENICGDTNRFPAIATVWGPGNTHNLIYGCVPEGEKIYVPTSRFHLEERQKMKRLDDYWYIVKQPVR